MRCTVALIVALLAGSAFALQRAPRNYAAHSGHILVRADQANVTDREFIELYGWKSPDRNTPCGHAARMRLEDLIQSGRLFLDASEELPEHMNSAGQYMLGYDESGESIFRRMIREGLALDEDNELDEEMRLLYLEAQEKSWGCHRDNDSRDIWETTSDRVDEVVQNETTTREEIFSLRPSLPFTARQTQRDPTYESSDWPTGFRTEQWVPDYIRRPVDFLFTPDGMLMVGLNEGLVLTVNGRRVRGRPFMDISTLCNVFQDRGLMSMAIPPNYRQNPWLYVFFVYEHDPRPSQYEEAKSSRVMKVRANGSGIEEERGSRTVILGSLNGPGCGRFGADSDCIPTEGKSHVGGALAFRRDGNLYVSVGDGAIAIVTDVAMRAQRFGIYSGKVLLIDQDGRGLRSNPFFNGNVNSRDSKIYAWGTRNIFNMHVDPDNDDYVYAGDTQWNDMEEVNVIRRGQNYGWPCYESFLRRPEYQNDRECRRLGGDHVLPLVGWRHRAGTGASMVGEKISIPGWPRRYQNVATYADMAQRCVAFCRVDGRGNLIENMERINIPYAAVQFRAGPGNAFYYMSVRDRGEIMRVTYTPDTRPVGLDRQYPAPNTAVSRDAGLRISARFTKSVEPETVFGNVRLVVATTGQVLPTTLTFDYPSRVFTLRVTNQLPAGTTLEVEVDGGAGGVRDLDRNVLPRNIGWQFRTGGRGGADTLAPAVDGTVPEDGARDVPITTGLSVTFTEPMNARTVTSSFRIQRASGGYAASTPLPVDDVEYIEASRELRFRAALAYSTQYLVTVEGGEGGVQDLAGNRMRGYSSTTFTTVSSSDRIRVEILQPAVGTVVSVGDTIQFRGRAFMANGAAVPASAFVWEYNVLHCDYEDENECHDHALNIIRGSYGGQVEAADHFDRFKYELRLSVQYNGETGVLTREVDLRYPDITLQSQPTGAQLSLSGYTRATPFTLPVARRSTMQLFAPATNGAYVFDRWSHGGPRVQSLTVLDGGVYVAIYRRADAPAEQYVRLATVPTTIPLRGSVTIVIGYSTNVQANIRANLQRTAPFQYMFGSGLVVEPGEGSVRMTIPYSQDLVGGQQYNLQLLMRRAGADERLDSASQLITAGGGGTGGTSGGTGGTGGSTADRIISVTPPDTLPRAGQLTFRVEYESSQDRDIAASIFDIANGVYSSTNVVRVGRSNGVTVANVQLTLTREIVRGRRYRIACAIRPVGGRGADRLDAQYFAVTA